MYGDSKQANYSTKIQVSSKKSLVKNLKAKLIHSLTVNAPEKMAGPKRKFHLPSIFSGFLVIVSGRV